MELANVGSADRMIRLIAGVILLALPFILGMSATAMPGIIMLVAGAILAITAVISFCPIYKIIGVRTNSAG